LAHQPDVVVVWDFWGGLAGTGRWEWVVGRLLWALDTAFFMRISHWRMETREKSRRNILMERSKRKQFWAALAGKWQHLLLLLLLHMRHP